MPADTELTLTPTTLLDAVNALLNSVGLASVDSLLDADSNLDSKKAFEACSRASAQVQAALGWYGSTEDYTIIPDTNSEIMIPPNWLAVRPKRSSSTWANKKVTVRQGKLYDLTGHTFKFTSAVDLTVTQALAFEDLPQAFRWYVTCKAGRAFAVGTYPTSGTFKFTAEEELKAKAEALQEDEMLRDQNLPETSPHFACMRRR
jgi:hypothetical protein